MAPRRGRRGRILLVRGRLSRTVPSMFLGTAQGGEEAESPSAEQSSLTASAFDNDADGSTGTTLTLTSRDENGVAVSGVPLSWSVQRITLDAADSLVTAAPATIADDGLEASIVTVQARKSIDAAYVLLRGIPAANVVIASTGSNNTVTQPAVATDANGQTSGSLVTTTAEAKTLSAAILGQTVTDTAAVTATGDAPDLHPNEPPGSVMFGDADGSVEESAGDAMGITWMGAWTIDGAAAAGNLAVITDATNPQGSGEALRFIFEQALNPRCATAVGTFPAEKSELYVSVRVKFNDAFGPKLFYIGLPNVAGSTDFYVDVGTTGRIRLVRQAISPLELIDSSEAAPKGNSTSPFTTGVWHHIELVAVAETTPGAGDGSATMWCDEVQVGQATSVEWGGNFGSLEWYGDINTVTDGYSYQLGELYLSGTDA